ncbi:hypothetical protein BVRB_8g185760 [Beta vulgaris subsp. vulgaris]|nr:hypothetical protein BVRB_8g185760 [Beta vulgaris subsp. vulgaris]
MEEQCRIFKDDSKHKEKHLEEQCRIFKDDMETFRAAKHPDREIYAQWNDWFDIKGDNKIPLHLLYNAMYVEPREGDDAFKKFFVVYVFGTFFSPISNRSVDVKVLKAVNDIENIKKLDWCKYVFNCLCRACKRYLRNEKNEFLGGCLLFLQVFYLHHLQFQGHAAPTNLPLIKHWVDEVVSVRFKEESIAGFGNGHVVLNSYPVCARVGYGACFAINAAEQPPIVDLVADTTQQPSIAPSVVDEQPFVMDGAHVSGSRSE